MDKTRIAHHYDTLDEEKVARRYIEAHQAMKEALESIIAYTEVQRTLDPGRFGPLDHEALKIAKRALTLANGSKP